MRTQSWDTTGSSQAKQATRERCEELSTTHSLLSSLPLPPFFLKSTSSSILFHCIFWVPRLTFDHCSIKFPRAWELIHARTRGPESQERSSSRWSSSVLF